MIDYENDDNLSREELVNIPAGTVNLARVFSVRSGLLYLKTMTDLAAHKAGIHFFHDKGPRYRAEEERRQTLLARKAAMEEVRDHADRLLLRIDEQQQEIEKRRRELEGRALYLHDGRRLWIDGNQYYDDGGIFLQGSDHREAETLARQHPEAATCSESQTLRQWQEKTDLLREKVLKERGGEADPEAAQQRLTGYRTELQAQIEQRRRETPVDYGDSDYRDMLVPSSAPAFNAAAAGEMSSLRAEKKQTGAAFRRQQENVSPAGAGDAKTLLRLCCFT